MLVEDVFLDKLWTLELLSTQGTQVFVLRQLLDVVLHKTSYFSETVKKTCHGPRQCSTTVIHFLFVAKIFSDTENVRRYFTRI